MNRWLILQPHFESVQVEPPIDVKNWSRSELNTTSPIPVMGGMNHPRFHVDYWVYQTRHQSRFGFEMKKG